MKIIICGNPGCGKTTISKLLKKNLLEKYKINFEIFHLSNLAKKFKTKEIKSLKTFDFDFEKLKIFLEKNILENKNKKNIILESHFSHLLNPKYFDLCIILKRKNKLLLEEYKKRKYDKKKINDNLEAQNFDIYFCEAIENKFSKKKILKIENNSLEKTIEKILKKIKSL